MFKINRTTEYGLISLQHMNRKIAAESTDVTSAREISDTYGLPFEITAKTLQRLKDTGLIQSAQGAKGGYTLLRSLKEITLSEFLRLMEGPQAVVVCNSSTEDKPCQCEYEEQCEIKTLMTNLNDRVSQFLGTITLNELTSTPSATLSTHAHKNTERASVHS